MVPLAVFVLGAAGPTVGRRSFVASVPFAPLVSFAEPSQMTKSVFLTGGNSGIGLEAAKELSRAGHTVYLPCRTKARAQEAAAQIGAATGPGGGTVVPLECDLSSLASVRRCATDFRASRLPLDVLVLNAAVAPGTSEKTARRTQDGFEETIGVNYLGHFLLADLLLPALEEGGGAQRPRLVVTASEVHNPEEPGGRVGSKAMLGDLGGLRRQVEVGESWDMVDGGPFDPDKAYKDSKLCDMFFMLELDRRLTAAKSRVDVNAFSPGLIPKSGLFRNQQPLFVRGFDFAASLAGVTETLEDGGECITYMALSPQLEGKHGLFLSDFPPGKHSLVPRSPSTEALDQDKARALWGLAERLTMSKGKGTPNGLR